MSLHSSSPLTPKDSNHLNSLLGSDSQNPPTRAIFFCDAAVQTESMAMGMQDYLSSPTGISDRHQSKLSADDLWGILKSSQDISSDINLSSGDGSPFRSFAFLKLFQLFNASQKFRLASVQTSPCTCLIGTPEISGSQNTCGT
jgi:hypothetical protein